VTAVWQQNWWELEWICPVQAGITMMAGEPEPDPEPGAGAEPAAQAIPADPQPQADDSDPQPQPDPPAPPQTTKPAGDEWWQRRINKLTAKAKALEAENAQLKQAPATPPIPPAHVPGAVPGSPEYQEAVRAEARALAAKDRFDQQCADIATAGQEAFGKDAFDRSVMGLVNLVDRSDPEEIGQYRSLIEAAISTGEAPRLVHLLGSDPNEATRLLALPPARMGVELAKLVLTQPDRTVSGAPKPASVPRGSGGGQAPHTSIDPTDPERSDRLSTAEWMRRRNEQSSRWDNQPRGGR